MVVRFTWQDREWREAYLLCTSNAKKASDPVPMGFLVAGVMLVGGLGDLYHSLQHSRGIILHDRLMPVLLLVLAAAPLSGIAIFFLRRRKQLLGLPSLPVGEQQVTFHEQGWSTFGTAEDANDRSVRPWSELRGHRVGRQVLAISTLDGTPAGVPRRALTADQESWLSHMLERKTAPHL